MVKTSTSKLHHRRAGLSLSASSIARKMKRKLKPYGCSVSRDVALEMTALVEGLLVSFLRDAAEQRTKSSDSKRRITALPMHRVLRSGRYGSLLPRQIAGIYEQAAPQHKGDEEEKENDE